MDSNVLLKTLYQWYTRERFNQLLQVLDRKNNDISLRLVDWLVTNHSKKHNTRLKTPEGPYIQVYVTYKNNLKAFSKKQFDPFCRRDRIIFNKFGVSLNTTIGQLNFFRWALSTGIVDYVKKHNKEIEKDMLDALNKKTIKNNKKNSGKKRSELSMCATKSFTCVNLPCLIVLD